MDIPAILDLIIIGLLRGGLYALMAAGLALLLGVMDVSNFAHGEFYMIGAYAAYFAYTIFGLHPILSILAAVLAGLATGALVEKVLFFPLRLRSREEWIMNSFLLTVGLSVIMQNLTLIIWQAKLRGIHEYWKGSIRVTPTITLPMDRVAAFLITILSITSLWFFLSRTKVGRAIRATAQDEKAAMLVSINPNRIYVITSSLTCMLAAVAGSALLPVFPAYPFMGIAPLNKSYFVVILAGLGNIGGSIIAGFLMGILETLCYYAFGAGWPDVVALSITILVLVLKPAGLFGTAES
jgi:branched-chain amino acid transport system permease protein